VKATSVFVRLQIFLFRLKYPTSFLAPLPGNGSYASFEPKFILFFLFLPPFLSPPSYHMDFTPIYKFFAPKDDLLEPPPSSHPILTDGYELRPAFIAMV
jgi:hypothetical protein